MPQEDENSEVSKNKISSPALSLCVDKENPEQLFGLTEKLVATESLVFLAEQTELLQPHLEALIPSTKRAFLQQFYSQTVFIAKELRNPVYRSVSAKSIEYEYFCSLMTSVRYDLKEILSQHSSYIDVILKVSNLIFNSISSKRKKYILILITRN